MTGKKSSRIIKLKIKKTKEEGDASEIPDSFVSVKSESKFIRFFKQARKYSVKIAVLFSLIISSFYLEPLTHSHFLGDFSFSELSANVSNRFFSRNLFIEPVKNVSKELPEMAIIGENSVKAVSPPALAVVQVLGNIIEEEELKRTSIISYIVAPGDTISSIAEKFNISVNTIIWANNLDNQQIKEGQELFILPVSGVLHTVRKGDTLSDIAEKYKVKVSEIVVFNNLSKEEDIYIGDMLVIPNGKIAPKKTVLKAPSSPPVADSYFIIPTVGIISQGAHGFNGAAVDISNSCGTPVVASAGGKVQRVGWIPVGGNIITILHSNGVVTYYGHLSAMTVVPGQMVAAGEIIGYIGNTGYTIGRTGCHLHFEVRGAKNFLTKYPVGSKVGW